MTARKYERQIRVSDLRAGEVAVIAHPGDPYTRARIWVGTPEALRERAAERPGASLGERFLREIVASGLPEAAATPELEFEAHRQRLRAARASHAIDSAI